MLWQTLGTTRLTGKGMLLLDWLNALSQLGNGGLIPELTFVTTVKGGTACVFP